MKIKIVLFLILVGVIYGITLSPRADETVTVESSLALANRASSYDLYSDSIGICLERHLAKTALHEKADAVTDSSTGSCDNLKSAIVYARDIYANLLEHFAMDSCHNGAADATTVLPTLITTSASYAEYKNFVDSLRLSMNAHFARTISTRYNLVMKGLVAKYISHCADTDVHYIADEVYNTLTFDSTNVDSSMAGANRYKSRWNSHIAAANANKSSEPHGEYNNTDSITAADATSYATLYDLVIDAYGKEKIHFAHAYEASVDSVHQIADVDTITTAIVVKGGGHIAADTKTYTAHTGAPLAYRLPAWDRMTIQYTGSSVSTGASFYHYGSLDGVNYAFIDSTSVTGNGATLKHFNTNYYPYMKIYLNKRTDGTYKIQFGGGK